MRLSPAHCIYFFSGISAGINSMQMLVLPWLVLQRTDDVLAMGAVSGAALTAILLGSINTRFIIQALGERATVLLSFTLDALSLLGFIWAFSQPTLSLPILIAICCIGGFIDIPGGIALESRFPELCEISNSTLEELNGRKESITTGASIFGPAIAGVLLSTFSGVFIFSLSLGPIAIASVFLFLLLKHYPSRQNLKQSKPSTWLTFVWLTRSPLLRPYLVLIVVIMACIASMDDVLLPAYVNAVSGEPAHIGYILAAFGSSAVMSAWFYGSYGGAIGNNTWIRLSVIGIMLIFGCIAFVPSIWTMIVASFLAGILSGAIGPLVDTVLLKSTPKKFRITMMSSVATTGLLGAPVIVFAHAWLIDTFSISVVGGLSFAMLFSLLFLQVDDLKTGVKHG